MRKNTPKRSCSILPKWKKGVKTAAHMYHPSHREYPPGGRVFSFRHISMCITQQSSSWVVHTYHLMCIMTSWWARYHLKSPASRLFIQPFILVLIKENINAPRHWPLCGEFTGNRWIPRTNGHLRGKCFHLMTSSWCTMMRLGQAR